jgi:predicted 3-demethylubiquinone-9 3-methyltransferase (glyoxalase superfamily)
MSVKQRLRPCLWFDDQAEEAARFYVGIEAILHMKKLNIEELRRSYEGEPSGARR